MLQRAASNAYSWWWASHIRTKQSKWLEQSLQDMEEKVSNMLKLIEEDGDSFIKRAEMYYKRRPELVTSIEEAYKAFRALADRYDLLSKELQNANHTIATVFPEQVQLAMAEDEDCPKPTKVLQNMNLTPNTANIPQVPKEAPPKKLDLKSIITKASRKHRAEKKKKAQVPEKSGLTKTEALEEIKKLQKEILALQTVKEFVKSSYESGIEKYWGLENQINDMQERVSRLQDEFNTDTLIEDDEARTLMAEAAIKSCQQTLAMLQEKQEKASREAQQEYARIEAAMQQINSFREKYKLERTLDTEPNDGKGRTSDCKEESELDVLIRETKEIEVPLDKFKEDSLDLSSIKCLTVTQLAEKIDQLVNKVIGLETAVSSQTVLVNTLRTETDHLNSEIKTLEEEKDNLVDDTQNLSTRVKKVEEKLNKIQNLNKNVENQSSCLQSNFAEARTNLGHLSERLNNVEPDEEEIEEPDSSYQEENKTLPRVENKDKKDEAKVGDAEDMKDVNIDIPVSDTSVTKQGETEKVSDTCVTKQGEIEKVSNTCVTKQGENEKAITGVSDKSVSEQEETEKAVREDVPVFDPNAYKQGENEKDSDLEKKSKEHVTSINAIAVNNNAEEAQLDDDNEDENWQEMLLSGVEDRETILLKEYTTILKNYKDIKKRLIEKEKKERDTQFDITLQMRELKTAIHKRDEEIQNLRQRLNTLEGDKEIEVSGKDVNNNNNNNNKNDDDNNSTTTSTTTNTTDAKDEDNTMNNKDDEIKLIMIDQTQSTSKVEEKLRLEIDAILDENLDFWLRFSTTFHQVQKFKTEVKDLQDDIAKATDKDKNKADPAQAKSDIRPIYKHLREKQTELALWLEQSGALKDELKRRFNTLCSIQEEITRALTEGAEEEDEIRFSSHQAAKLQGEILNMKQENNKVREELQAGLDRVQVLQLENEKTLNKLDDEFGISTEEQGSLSQARHVPLRSFIFGTKPAKKKSIFSCMHPNRRYQVLRTGMRPSNNN